MVFCSVLPVRAWLSESISFSFGLGRTKTLQTGKRRMFVEGQGAPVSLPSANLG